MPIRSFIALALISVLAIAGKPALTNPEPQRELNVPTYYSDIKPIINNYCISCHSGNAPSGGFGLTSYEEVRGKTEFGPLLKRINSPGDPMPQDGLMPLRERKIFEDWAKTGFKEMPDSLTEQQNPMTNYEFKAPEIVPVDINEEGFELFSLMPGHWIGKMQILGLKLDWFAFDYRPISASHVHGIYEAGTQGNIFTSFFVTNYNGKRTIMARNGGVLNGLYRTSYFVLDKVKISDSRQYFRLVDAYGGKDIMWMELTFSGNKLEFNSYTSRLGLNGKPKLHMHFEAERRSKELATKVANRLNYPQNKVDKDFSEGFPKPNWGENNPVITSSTYLHRSQDLDLLTLGKLSGDPYTVDQVPHLSTLRLNLELNDKIREEKLLVYLSGEPLAIATGALDTEHGYIKQDIFNSIMAFPELVPGQDSFTFHYLHPGPYYITVVADLNKDGFASPGDISCASQWIEIRPESEEKVTIENINFQN